MESGKLGIIGYGNMGAAIIRGLISAGLYKAGNISVFDVDSVKRDAAFQDGCTVTGTVDEVGAAVDTLIIAVKPGYVCTVLEDLGSLKAETLIISVAAGVTISSIEAALGGNPVIRVMPNTPCMVGEGASAVVRGTSAGNTHTQTAMNIMGALGYACEVPESLINAVTGLSGSGPAYVALVIDALSDGGVKMGLPRPTALKLAAQTVLGAAKMIIEGDLQPSALRDMVTSPGGTTIEGISVLESRAVRSALIDAVEAAVWKAEELG
ncbi:pyrroline-5-carboxylate reductase [Candidatus Latescibacterota bacterium]